MHYSIWPLLYDLWDVFFWGIPLITVFGIGHFSSIYVLGGIIGGLCRLYFDLLIEEMGGYSSRSSVGASDSISALMAVLALTVPLYPIPFFYVPFLGSVCALITGWSFLYSLGAFFGFWGVGVSHGHLAGYLVGLLYWVIVLKRPIFGLSIDQTFSFIRKEISSIKSKV
jgi:membrane associated rhomboid family serine protease